MFWNLRRLPTACLLYACLWLVTAAPAFAASQFSIHGTVKDSSGAVIPNAQVAITDVATGVTRTVSIDIYDQVQASNYDVANKTALVLLLFSFVVLSVVYGTNRRALSFWGKR